MRGPDGAGPWIPEQFATRFGLSVGDELTFATLQLGPSNNGPPTAPAAPSPPVRIAAVYADITTVATDEYWCCAPCGAHAWSGGGETVSSRVPSGRRARTVPV